MDPPPLSELDLNFEPQTRARSNTWPLPRPENYVEDPPSIKCEEVDNYYQLDIKSPNVVGGPSIPGLPGGQLKKNSSRRNAWGNLSYADLITQAISSTPEKRLTLSQIYEWMVHNIPYFNDKGDSNSSAGWKVSPFSWFYSSYFFFSPRALDFRSSSSLLSHSVFSRNS